MPGKQSKKPLLLGQKGTKPAQHWHFSVVQKRPPGGLSRSCHRPFEGKTRHGVPRESGHPPLCEAENRTKTSRFRGIGEDNARVHRSRRGGRSARRPRR